jgi:adenylosuccinate synthase
VAKAYVTRVGNGPFPTELTGEEGERLREIGAEYGSTTGRPRRCGWFDATVVRYSARVNGLSHLAVTKLDVLDSFAEIPVGISYQLDGARCEEFPAAIEALERARPVYETLPGWRRPTGNARRLSDLPSEARVYLDRLETLAGVPIRYVSVGTRRDQIISCEP